MRVVVLGGTRFVGRAISRYLVSRGDEVMLVHRGDHEPPIPGVRSHLHADRAELPDHRDRVAAFAPDAAVEVHAMNGADADAALAVLPEGIATVAVSSGDVYRAFQSLHNGTCTDAVPLAETAPVRTDRFVAGPGDENLEVEERYLARGATILRLGAVYGPHDYQRRFEFVLRRVRARRTAIPVGPGGFLFSKVYVGDVAVATRLALETTAARGRVLNIVESATAPFRLLTRQILRAAGADDVETVTVPAAVLPADLALTGDVSQHLLLDSTAARDVLGWRESPYEEVLRASVRWHLDNPPAGRNRPGLLLRRRGAGPGLTRRQDSARAPTRSAASASTARGSWPSPRSATNAVITTSPSSAAT